MVRKLTSEQTRKIIEDLCPQGLLDFCIPEPLSQAAVVEFCSALVKSPVGVGFGWFDTASAPRGFLVGLVMPDPMTGRLHGMEHAWWVAPKYRGKASLELFKAFEEECRSRGCSRLTFGFSTYVEPDKMKRLYRKLGLSEFSVAMSKEL